MHICISIFPVKEHAITLKQSCIGTNNGTLRMSTFLYKQSFIVLY